MKKIDTGIIEKAMTYQEYVEKVEIMLKDGVVSTRGTYIGEEIIHYTHMNLQRMHRLDKTTKLQSETIEKIISFKEERIWLNITEGWCGDAAQIVPVIEKMAQLNPRLQHRLIFRDEHTDIIDAFLTNEGRAIPKILILDIEGNILSSWGPRPNALQEIMIQQKAKLLSLPKEERKAYFDIIKMEVQQWYNNDKTKSIQKEFLDTSLL